jgi:DNA-binding NarL/FixJ family response regulator
VTTSIDHASLSLPCLDDLNDVAWPPPRSSSTSQAASIREQAVASDSQTSVSINLARLWHELSLGLCKVVDAFFHDARCYLVTIPVADPPQSIDRRRLGILEAVLSGVLQKRVAIELALAPSTIALTAQRGLNFMGLRCRPSRAHPLLMLAAMAARAQQSSVHGSVSFVARGNEQLRVIAIQRPELALGQSLPPAEFAVIRGLVEGAGYDEIAQLRGTSTRTIANQIAAVFRRLKVSGRSELVIQLFSKEVIGERSLSSEMLKLRAWQS